jgi:hypothetical protein
MTGRGGPQVSDVVEAALVSGPVSRTDLFAAAVAARAPTEVLESFLRLPERCYHDADELRCALHSQ